MNKCCLNIVLFSLIFCNCYIIVFSLVDFKPGGRGFKSRLCQTFFFFFFLLFFFSFLAHLSRRLVGELIVYPWSGVRPSSVVRRRPSSVVHNFKHKYLCNQWADRNQILSEASLGWGKGCIRFWARSDQNSGFHGNRKLP